MRLTEANQSINISKKTENDCDRVRRGEVTHCLITVYWIRLEKRNHKFHVVCPSISQCCFSLPFHEHIGQTNLYVCVCVCEIVILFLFNLMASLMLLLDSTNSNFHHWPSSIRTYKQFRSISDFFSSYFSFSANLPLVLGTCVTWFDL